jgi:hypothetical protein
MKVGHICEDADAADLQRAIMHGKPPPERLVEFYAVTVEEHL